MAQTIASGLKINYDDLGQGEPALLFLSAWCSSACYAQLPLKCATNRRVLVLDWRGFGKSESPAGDYGVDDLLEDALAVIEASGVRQVVPVTLSHGGWIGIELRRKLGERVPKIVHLDWLVLPPPSEYIDAIKAMASPDGWKQSIDQLFAMWLHGGEANSELVEFVRGEMGSYSGDIWMRTGREILSCYERWSSPIDSLSTLKPSPSVLHIYSQPNDPEYLSAQKSFAAKHSWFNVYKLQGAKTHLPTFEAPDEIADAIEKFLIGAIEKLPIGT